MEKQIELIPFLTQVVEQAAVHYKNDLQYDIIRLQEAVYQPEAEERAFYWMARPCGTQTVRERDAFLVGSDGHTIWTHYTYEAPKIQAYRIFVTGGTGGEPVGTVRRLDYPKQVRRVMANAIPAVRMELTFLSGEVREIALEDYPKEREWLFREYGMAKRVRYCPREEADLRLVLAIEQRRQKRVGPRTAKKRKGAAVRES